MTYDESLAYIAAHARHTAPTLERIRALLHALGDPQDSLKFVHVAGTNGKGSTCAMLAAILQSAGYRTGLYTSPYLIRYNERMRVDGASISDSELAALTARLAEAVEAVPADYTEFDLDTALAMLYFAARKCRIVVLEVGLGGRLDPTNVIAAPECAVITNIGLDHTEYLGDTSAKIAAEKAGIIKPGCTAVLYDTDDDDVLDTVSAACRAAGAGLRIASFDELELLDVTADGQDFCYCDDTPLHIPLLGSHQLCNAAVALEAVEVLRERGWRIKPEAVAAGLAAVRWPARFEVLADDPTFVLDGGHNVQCAEAVRDNLLEYFPDCRRVLLVGMMRDKDAAGVLSVLCEAADEFVCVTPAHYPQRALPAAELCACLREMGAKAVTAADVKAGITAARMRAGADGMVCAVGSLYLAGEVLEAFGRSFD